MERLWFVSACLSQVEKRLSLHKSKLHGGSPEHIGLWDPRTGENSLRSMTVERKITGSNEAVSHVL